MYNEFPSNYLLELGAFRGVSSNHIKLFVNLRLEKCMDKVKQFIERILQICLSLQFTYLTP